MGLIWALMSVALVSAAQLTLRAAMTTLPSATQPLAFLLHLLHFETGTLALLLGLLGYVASMACWFFALISESLLAKIFSCMARTSSRSARLGRDSSLNMAAAVLKLPPMSSSISKPVWSEARTPILMVRWYDPYCVLLLAF